MRWHGANVQRAHLHDGLPEALAQEDLHTCSWDALCVRWRRMRRGRCGVQTERRSERTEYAHVGRIHSDEAK